MPTLAAIPTGMTTTMMTVIIVMTSTIITTDISTMVTTITTDMNTLQWLQLLQLTSPSLPIGGFAWSQGLESAIEQNWLQGEADFANWVEGVLQHNFTWQELPLLARLYQAAVADDMTVLKNWNDVALALRETSELRNEDVQMGGALLKLMRDLQYPFALRWQSNEISYIAAFAIACAHHQIPLSQACTGFVWSWLENQIAAALKLFPLGQTAGQRVFQQIAPLIPAVLEHAQQVQDDEIGFSLPGLILASMQHEEQYSRLFRS